MTYTFRYSEVSRYAFRLVSITSEMNSKYVKARYRQLTLYSIWVVEAPLSVYKTEECRRQGNITKQVEGHGVPVFQEDCNLKEIAEIVY